MGELMAEDRLGSAERLARSMNPSFPTALAYDGTLEGLMTSIFVAYASHCDICDIQLGKCMQPRLGQQVVAVPTDMDAALRVQRGIVRTCGNAVWRTVMTAAASDDPNTGTIIYRFVRYCLDGKRTAACSRCARKTTCTASCGRTRADGVLQEWANPKVEPVLRLERQVSNEIDKMRQFVRFQHVQNDLWFAQCNPSASVVPFVMDWFGRRFNTQRFAIYDEAHGIVGISEGGHWQLASTDEIAPPPHMSDEALMQDAWKRFYKALSIDARHNPELRRHFMPMRLWKNITEMQETA